MSVVLLSIAGARTASAQAESADLAITAVSADVSDVSPSVVVTSWSLTNNGPSGATDLVLVVTLPVGTTLTMANIAARPVCTFEAASRQVSCPLTGPFGGSTLTAVTLLNIDNPAGATVEILGTVSSSTSDPDQSNNTRSVSVTVPGGPVTNPSGGPSAELVLKASSRPAASLAPAGTAFLSWDLFNAGPAVAQHVTLVFQFPEGAGALTAGISAAPCADFAPGALQVTCVRDMIEPGILFDATVSFSITGLPPGTVVEVVATVSSETLDPDPANNQSTGTFSVAAAVAPTGGSLPSLVGLAGAVLAAGIVVVLVTRRRATNTSHPSRPAG